MERNNSIHRLKSNGKFRIVPSENVTKRSHNVAFSKSKSSFCDEGNIIFFYWNKYAIMLKLFKSESETL